MSTFDSSNEIVQSSNGILNGVNHIDGIVPDLTNGFQNLANAIESDEITESDTIPQNVNGGTYDPLPRLRLRDCTITMGIAPIPRISEWNVQMVNILRRVQ